MKHFLFFLLLVTAGAGYLLAHEHGPLVATIVSEETTPQSGTITVTVSLEALEEVEISPDVTWRLPTGWQANTTLSSLNMQAGDSTGFTSTLTPPTNLPYYPQAIEVVISYEETSSVLQIPTQASVAPPTPVFTRRAFAAGHVYFTPWGTAEVFSDIIFNNLNRVWQLAQTPEPTRITQPLSNFPVSDLDGTEPVDEDTLALMHVPGLAYGVLMTKAAAAQYDIQVGDDEDPEDSTTAPNAKVTLLKNFSGTIRGRLVSEYYNDLGNLVEIPLSGVQVVLKESDEPRWSLDRPGFNEKVTEVLTDRDGNFVISYSFNQPLHENNQVELFLKFKTQNPSRDIQIKRDGNISFASAMLGNNFYSRTWDLGGHGDGANINLGEVHLNDAEFKVLHWMNRAWDFSEDHGIDMENGLTVFMHKSDDNSSFFIADYLDGLPNYPQLKPTIRLTEGGGLSEGTPYHEFGHFMMWQIQGQHYNLILSNNPNSSHRLSQEDTPFLAWSEGWASGMEAIIDAYYWEEDEEYARERNTRPFLEARLSYVGIQNGFLSEYYIATALNDLWDGADKGLPNNMPGSSFTHGFNDRNNWDSDDDVSIPFELLVEAVKTRPYDVEVFYRNLLEQVSDCDTRAKIARCFHENRLVFDIAEYESTASSVNPGLNSGLHSGDGPFEGRSFSSSAWVPQSVQEIPIPFPSPITGSIINYGLGWNWDIRMEFIGEQDYTMLYKTAYSGTTPLAYEATDTETWTDNVVLDMPGTTPGEFSINASPGATPATVHFCGSTLSLINGIVHLGATGNELTLLFTGKAKLLSTRTNAANEIHVWGNTTIIMDHDAFLLLSNQGNITLHDNAQVVVKEGASIVLEGYYSRLNLLDNSKLVLENGAYTCFRTPNNINTNGRGVAAIEVTPEQITGWKDDVRNSDYNPNFHTCNDIFDLFAHDFNVTIENTTPPSCTNTDFVFNLTGNTIPQDAAIYWYVPETWTNYVEGSNGNFWLTSINGTTNESGQFSGGNVYVIIKSPLGIQQSSLYIPDLQHPVLTTTNTYTDIFICNEVVNGQPFETPNIEVMAAGTTGPYTFNWADAGNVNYAVLTDNGYTFEAELSDVQPTTTPQVTQLSAIDQLGCVSNPIQFTILPSSNTWNFVSLAIPENNVQGLNGAANRNNIITDEDGNIYFTGIDGNVYYYFWDTNVQAPPGNDGLWVPVTTPADNSAGSVALYEDATTVYVYYKGTDNRIHTFVKDKATGNMTNDAVYANSPTDVKDMVHVTANHEVFYRNTSDQLVQLNDDDSYQTYSTYPVHGFNLVSQNGRLYYKSFGNFVVLDISNGTVAQQTAQIADHSYLALNSSEELFYVTYDNTIKQAIRNINGTYQTDVTIPYTATANSQYTGSNGQITLNPATGVLYYVGWDGGVYQLYLNNNMEWISVDISGGNVGIQSQTPIYYHSPHLLFFDSGIGIIGNSFYYDSGCYSLVEKSGEQQANFSISPNPASEELYITFGADEGDNVKLQLINMIGQQVHTASWRATEEGYQEQSSTVNHLPAGTYVCRLLVNDSEVAYRKVVIVD